MGVVSATVFNGIGFKVGVAVLVVLLILVIWGATKTSRDVAMMTKAKDPPKSQVEKKPTEVPPVNVSKPVPKLAPEKPKDSEVWRLVGSYGLGQGIQYYVITDGNVTRRLSLERCKTIAIDMVCTFNGEYVASYTGRKSFDMAALSAAGLSSASNSVAR